MQTRRAARPVRRAPLLCLVGVMGIAACGGVGGGGDDAAAGGGASGSGSGPGVQTLGFGLPDAIATERVAAAEERGITVDVVEGGFDEQQFLSAVAAGDPPDAVYLARTDIGTYAARGALQPLDDCVEQEGVVLDDFREPALDQVVLDDVLYGLPEFYSVRVVLADQQVLEEAGVSPEAVSGADWDALTQAAAAMDQADGSQLERIGYDPKLPEFLPLWAKANGVDLVDAEGQVHLDDPAVVEVVEKGAEIVEAAGGWSAFQSFRDSWDFFGAENQFASDQLGAMPMEDWYVNVLADVSPDAGVTVQPFLDRQGQPLTYASGSAWAIPEGVEDYEAACTFAATMTAKDTWVRAAKARVAEIAEEGEGFYTGTVHRQRGRRRDHLLRGLPAHRQRADRPGGGDHPLRPGRRLLAAGHPGGRRDHHRLRGRHHPGAPGRAGGPRGHGRGAGGGPGRPRRGRGLMSGTAVTQAAALPPGTEAAVTEEGRGPGRAAARRGPSWRRRQNLAAYAFLSPWLVGLAAFTVGPMIASLVLSFTAYDLIGPPEYVGGANYARVLEDDKVWRSLVNTVYYTVLHVPLTIVTALALALMMQRVGRAAGAFRTLVYLPVMTPPVAAAAMFLLLLNGQTGLVNEALGWVGIDGPGWTTDPGWIKPGLVLMSLWSTGSTAVIYLAALNGVPRSMYEAAMLDGASAWQRLRYVTVPMISGAIYFTVIVNTIASLQFFTEAYAMYFGNDATRSRSGDAALFYVINLFQEAFQFLNMGYASALAWLLFLVIAAVTFVQTRVARRTVHYEGE